MKRARKAMDEIRKRSKGRMTDRDVEEFSKYQSEYMKHSLRPMLISIGLLMILFPFFTRYVGDVRIVNGTATVHGMNVTVREGAVMVDGNEAMMYDNVFFANGRIYELNDSKISTVILLMPFSLPVFGNTIGWLFSYVVAVLIISQVLRRMFGMGV